MLALCFRTTRRKWLLLLGLAGVITFVVFSECNWSSMCDNMPGIKQPQQINILVDDTDHRDLKTDATHKGNEAKVYRWRDGKWTRIHGFCSKGRPFQSAKLKTPFGSVKMYIHNIHNDIHVSGSIDRTGMWEAGGVAAMLSNLKTYPGEGFLDLGSQLGTYSLVAAKMGRKVVAVDPLVENVVRLCRTVQENNLTHLVTILFTALSDGYKTVSFKRFPGNIGGTHISESDVKFDASDVYNSHFINTVRLDDILPFVDFHKAFVKIDVENHEFEALKEGRQLFASKDIRAILMEWFQMRTSPNGEKLKDFLTNISFRAHEPYELQPLSRYYKDWPHDVMWMKV